MNTNNDTIRVGEWGGVGREHRRCGDFLAGSFARRKDMARSRDMDTLLASTIRTDGSN